MCMDDAYTSFVKKRLTIYDLPAEILENVFLTSHIGSTMAGIEAVTNLCEVCRWWRAIALSTPGLWTSLEVVIRGTGSTPSQPLLLQWLQLSGNRPLTISLVIKYHDPSILDEPLTTLLAEIHRWKTLHLSVDMIFHPFPKFPSNLKAPMLERIDFDEVGPMRPWLTSLIACAPGIRQIHDSSSTLLLEYQLLPWSQLTHIYMTHTISDIQALKILELTPKLVECHVAVNASKASQPTTTTVCRSLRTLSVITTKDMNYFFQTIVTPTLTSLELIYEGSLPWHPRISTELVAYLARTTFQIETFIIRNLFMSSSQLLDCLRHLSPSLANLHIYTDVLPASGYNDVENFDDKLIMALSCDKTVEEEVLCPRLERISLERCVNAEDGKLSKMIASRWKKNITTLCETNGKRITMLRNVYVRFRYHSHSRDQISLREMFEQGLQGTVRFGSPLPRLL